MVNLQDTKLDKKCDLKISYYVDTVMEELFKKLGLEIPEYQESLDPTKKDTGEWVEKLPKLLLPKKEDKPDAKPPAKRAKVEKEDKPNVKSRGKGRKVGKEKVVEVDREDFKSEPDADQCSDDGASEQIKSEPEVSENIKDEV